MDGGIPDSGTMLPVKCSSGMKWTSGNAASEWMNPGYACRSCHLGQNFLGQNPRGESNLQYAMFFMGTAFADFQEENLCMPKSVPAGAVVEILGADGGVALSLAIDPASGNFRSTSTTSEVPLPYRARIRANGMVRTMAALQMSGDCNTCHTEQGREGAPGRIVWPQ